jgi:hypothetical protein
VQRVRRPVERQETTLACENQGLRRQPGLPDALLPRQQQRATHRIVGAFDRGTYSVELVSTADERNGCGIGHEVNLRVTTVSENPSSMPAAATARLPRVLSRRTP